MNFHRVNLRRSTNNFSAIRLRACVLLVLGFCAFPVQAQNDINRETVAVTYPLDQTVEVKFRGTTRLPRLKGTGKIKRTGRRGTRVELSIENLPRPFELGAPYTTYILWAISPEGRVDSLGEIKRSGSFIFDSKVDVTTPLQTFALIVTAEPHFLVRTPSRVVVLENLPPRNPNGAEVATVAVQYIGNTSDYFNDARVPEVADQNYATTPVSLLGARQAVALARYAGAGRDAADELRDAEAQLEQAENAWRLKNKEADVDRLARGATSVAVQAEEIAETRKGARARREEVARRDAAVREAEQGRDAAGEELERMRTELARERRERELIERDLANTNNQLRDARTEVARLRDDLQSAQSAASEAQIKLARIEGERSAEEARRQIEQRTLEARNAFENLRLALSRFGTVREAANNSLVLVLPETLWATPRTAQLNANSAIVLEPLAALLANNADWRITVESHTDNRGADDALRRLTDERARLLVEQLTDAGIDAARLQAIGVGASRPIADNRTLAARARNRRIEVTLTPAATAAEAASSSVTDSGSNRN